MGKLLEAKVVPPARFERTTFPLGGGRSIQLSYGGSSRQFSHGASGTGKERGYACMAKCRRRGGSNLLRGGGPGQRRRRCRKRAVVTGSSGTAKPRHTTATLASAPALDLRPEAGKLLHGPSRAQGVCVQPAMDGRRPALGAGRGQAGGAHPLCAGRAARTAAEKCAACAAHTRTEK